MLKEMGNILFSSRDICLMCRDEPAYDESYICEDCYGKLEVLNKEIDMGSPYIHKSYYSLSYNRYIREKISDYKFNGKNYLYKAFGELILDTVRKHRIDGNIDLIAYVPSHRKKEALRGYNQAELLAKYLSKSLNKPISRGNLIKIKKTKDQSSLDAIDRVINLKKSFHIRSPEEIKSKNILLIDDIITTGVTMGECARLLLRNGAKEVTVIALTSSKIQ